MIREIKPFIWKEMRAIRRRLRGLVINIFLISLLFSSMTLYRIFMKNEGAKLESFAQQGTIYFIFMMTYVGLIFTLRFWEEKASGTIESLLALPSSINIIILGKVLGPAIFGEVVGLLLGLLFGLLVYFCFGVSLSYIWFIVAFGISFAFIIPFGIINGFSMWHFNRSKAAIIQIFSLILLFSSISYIWIEINVFSIQIIGVVISVLWLIAVFCLRFSDPEKVILRIIDE